MLKIKVGGEEFYDEIKERFISNKSYILELEHSLLSISKWESKWQKAFLDKKKPRTIEETIDYIRCMTINDVDQEAYNHITSNDLLTIEEYINNKMTATWFSNQRQGAPSREIITSELIYYWMISNNIPFDCEKWHLNRLLTLIRVCEIKQTPQKKMSQRDLASRNHALNKSRRAKHHSRG